MGQIRMQYEGFLRAKKGLAKGHVPKLAAAGTGGSYFISGEDGEQVAVFKPQDEEPLAVNNPKGNSGPSQEGFRRGVRPGEGATREVAAYLLVRHGLLILKATHCAVVLSGVKVACWCFYKGMCSCIVTCVLLAQDHEHFSGVPPTAMVGFRADMEAKIGSLQVSYLLWHGAEDYLCSVARCASAEQSLSFIPPVCMNANEIAHLADRVQAFVEAEGDCEERGTGAFDVEEVHKVAILDMRLANTDRNGGNILVRRKPGESSPRYELVPIDHGYCLPSSFQDISFEWIYWPQVCGMKLQCV